MSDTGSIEGLLQALRARPFSVWSYEEKCLAKYKRPMPHLQVHIVDGKQNRKFQDSWYVRYPWLTGCAKTKNLFCYVCILFGGENKWTLHGIPVTKNFVRMAEKHQGSKKHLQNQQSHSLLGRWRIEEEGESSLHVVFATTGIIVTTIIIVVIIIIIIIIIITTTIIIDVIDVVCGTSKLNTNAP
jgi:hypothetical protein